MGRGTCHISENSSEVIIVSPKNFFFLQVIQYFRFCVSAIRLENSVDALGKM